MEVVQLIVQKKWNGRKRSETVGNGRKQSETWSGQNLFNPIFFLNKHFRAMPFFFWRSKGVQGETVSNMFLHNFPLGHLWTFKKKRRCAEMLFFKKFGLNKFWPDHVSDCFRPFPTVSDRFRPFHFFWTINWTTSIYGRLIQCKPVQTMTLKFFGATLVRVHCTTYCILTLISNIP